MKKTCNDCKRHLPHSEFNKRRDRSKRGAGLSSYCRSCLSARWKRWAHGEVA